MKLYNFKYFLNFYSALTLLCLSLLCCKKNTVPSDIYQKIDNSVEYINPETALGNKDFKTCNDNIIFNYYNPQSASYSGGKNNLRDYILSNYNSDKYSDSGYLNILFVINCKGEAGRYKVYENNLDLEPQKFNPQLKTELLNLTMKLKKWNPNVIRGEYVDSSMYISYRIENGEITEILP
ncbi:hypothetical protein [Winogradskyella jejuensis]|uniref:Uncharacterized protein n=1 Tax=Winogradskyella jejuensis TaxID=1089305 RepID=A0A1M5NQ95_9FLAO|nr:hypothetical protein [Winogradskyella jejuensis]SHG91731.1 hypothetical protein SAMN05444148_1269 [Winogradskyella jejuensis]